MVFHWSLNDSKSPQLFRTLLSILAVLNNDVVWMVSTHPPTSKSSSPFNNPSVTLPKAPITIVVIVIVMFHSLFVFLKFPEKVQILILLFTFFQFYSVVNRYSKVHNFANSLFFFLFCLLWGLVFWPTLGDPFEYQNSIEICVCHSPGQMLGCAYTICPYSQI